MRARISGLAQPTYVLDLPGGFGKVVLDSANVEKTDTGHRIRDFAGIWHDYPPLADARILRALRAFASSLSLCPLDMLTSGRMPRPCPRRRLKKALTLWRVCSRHTTP